MPSGIVVGKLTTNHYLSLTGQIPYAGWAAEAVAMGGTKAKPSGGVVSGGNRLQAGFFQPLLHVAVLQRREHFVHLALNE
jgi:hypothetical protein